MSTIHRSRTAISAFAAVLMLALSAPIAVHAQDQVPAEERVLVAEDQALAPVAGLSWDETSGYGSVEASRAAIALPATSTTTEVNRVLVAQHALEAGDLGSMQEDVLFAVAAASSSWDVTSGYGSVEASRAANALAAASATATTQVPSDVRWAPDTVPASLADSREAVARRAAPAFPEWDAARWSPVEPSQATSPDYLPAALAAGTRTESAHLATVPLPGEAVEARRTQR